MVRAEFQRAVLHEHLVGVFHASQSRRFHARADLDALDRVDRHQRGREIRVELAVDRSAQPGGHAARRHLHLGADGIARLADVLKMALPLRDRLRVGDPEIVAVDRLPVEALAVDPEIAHPGHVAPDPNIRGQLGENRAGHRPGGHPGGGLAGGAAAAAAMVAMPVFQMVGHVGVAGAERPGDAVVVARSLIDVLDGDLDRRSGGLPLEHARQDSGGVRLLALRGVRGAARPAPVKPSLQGGLVQLHARRAAVDDHAQRGTVALAPGGEAENAPEGVEAHGISPSPDRNGPSEPSRQGHSPDSPHRATGNSEASPH